MPREVVEALSLSDNRAVRKQEVCRGEPGHNGQRDRRGMTLERLLWFSYGLVVGAIAIGIANFGGRVDCLYG